MTLGAVLLVGLSAGPAVGATTGWQQFHGNPAHTGYNASESTLGIANVGQLHQVWRGQTDQTTGIGSPSVAAGRVVLPLFDGGVTAWDETTGASLWSFQAADLVESTPAIAGGRVFVVSNDGILHALAAWNGHELWTASTGGAATSPAFAGGVVVTAGYLSVQAFDAASGDLLWSAPVGSVVRSAPAFARGRVFVSVEDGRVYAFDAATGTRLWRHAVGTIQLASPVVVGPRVFQCSSAGLTALGLYHGAVRWSAPGVCSLDSTPAVANGVVYANGSGTAVLTAVDAASGASRWSVPGGAAVWGGPVVANGVAYVPLGDGTIAGYDVGGTHARLWRSVDDGFGDSNPVVVDARVFAAGGDSVFAFGI